MMYPTIVSISGKARHGKTTFADYLWLNLHSFGYKAQILYFADGVKEEAKRLGWDGVKDDNGRALLQVIGDMYRNVYGKDYWIKQLERKIQPDYHYVIIPDTRYFNEALYFRKRGMKQIVVRIERINPDGSKFDNGLAPAQKNHISEVDMDSFKFDWVFVASDKEELKEHARFFAKELMTI